MNCVQVFPLGNFTRPDFQRFITRTVGDDARFAQIEQASYDVRVGYAGFATPEIAKSACNKLNKADFNGIRVHARLITPVEDDYGILVGPKGFVQESNYDSSNNSRYSYPGQASSPAAGSSKKHTNRRSYHQQQTDPRNFGSIANTYNENAIQNQPNPPFQQNSRFPPPPPQIPGRQLQYPEQGFDQRNTNTYEDSINQYERPPSQSKESKSKSSSKHRKHRRDSSESSSSSSESSDSSPRQSRHKHRHHHHHHRRSK